MKGIRTSRITLLAWVTAVTYREPGLLAKGVITWTCCLAAGPGSGHYRLARTLNSPQPLTCSHPPILVAGGGEKKTPRLVAEYAHACNVGATPELEHKLAALRHHCEDVGRDYDDITKTVITRLDPGPRGERGGQVIEQLAGLAAIGVSHVQTQVPGVAGIAPLEVFAERITPAAAKL